MGAKDNGNSIVSFLQLSGATRGLEEILLSVHPVITNNGSIKNGMIFEKVILKTIILGNKNTNCKNIY
ncbi:hypothetical protein GCM10009430_24060 [Aquimarina litoralis]|uniref:Uncharacterized protein n=1 Tax=Aquimarina litoralis TaxID=584605 RepID=A0ABN1IVA0_9FLAO